MIYAEQGKKQHFLPQQLRRNQRCHGAPRCEFQLRGFRGRVHGSDSKGSSSHFLAFRCISMRFACFGHFAAGRMWRSSCPSTRWASRKWYCARGCGHHQQYQRTTCSVASTRMASKGFLRAEIVGSGEKISPPAVFQAVCGATASYSSGSARMGPDDSARKS